MNTEKNGVLLFLRDKVVKTNYSYITSETESPLTQDYLNFHLNVPYSTTKGIKTLVDCAKAFFKMKL